MRVSKRKSWIGIVCVVYAMCVCVCVNVHIYLRVRVRLFLSLHLCISVPETFLCKCSTESARGKLPLIRRLQMRRFVKSRVKIVAGWSAPHNHLTQFFRAIGGR